MYASTRASFVPMALPEMWNDVGRAHHRISWLAPEGGGEGGEVGERPVVAPFLRRVRIGAGPRPDSLGAILGAPALRVGNEESLFRREAVDELLGPAVPLERALEGVVSREQAAQVGDVLAFCQLAVHVDGVDLDVAVELVD